MTDLQRIESALARIRALVEEQNPAPSFCYQVGRPAQLYWWQDENQSEK